MKEIRLANKIVTTLTKDRIHYPGRLLADITGIIARCGILLLLYWYVFKLNNGSVNGTTFIVIGWSIFFYFAFSTLRLRDISKSVMQDVQSGNIETLLSKPISYIWYRVWWQVGLGLYSFIVISVLGGAALYFLIGVPATMTIGIFVPTLLLTFILCAILSLILYLIVGLLAFWIEDINPVFWMVDKAVMILGGSYLPIALFPVFMYKIALYSPFGAAQFITHTVNTTWQSDWRISIALQVGWILILGILAYGLFSQARKKVSVNGG
jgi:ABC-2 type transport system permease protein